MANQITIEGAVTQEQVNDLNELMNTWHDVYLQQLKTLAEELGVSEGAARFIFYLRDRSRWTQRKEDYLIWLDQNAMPFPSMMEDFVVPDSFPG